MRFEPIAVVGQSCILPDALNVGDLWTNIEAGRVSVSQVPAGRWRLPRSRAMGTPSDSVDRTWTDQGGYVRGFESVFEPEGFQVGSDRISRLDPAFQWVLHGAREALRDSGRHPPLSRTGLILGNLSFPTAAMAQYAERVWRDGGPDDRPDPWNRFCSGLPAHLAAKALGLGAGAYALDAACASSLYAVKLACDRLHDGTADLMLAGAVNCADDLFIHLGFCALSAMSRTGRSRPFEQGADGLVPAEGSAFAALMRLDDAVAAGHEILGVIRGVGLSNDGSDGGLLNPSEHGQVRAMRAAYESAGIDPRSVSLLECHATGTRVGDAVEARAISRVFDGADAVPVGSVKSNLGHPVTAAGMAGLLKVLGAMRARVRPATVGVDEPTSALAGTPIRLLTENEPWHGPRRAAISAFGFGGNNAHMVVDAWEGTGAGLSYSGGADGRNRQGETAVQGTADADDPVVIVAFGARVGAGSDSHHLTRALLDGTRSVSASMAGPATTVNVEIDGLRFPPRDLERAQAQQLMILEAARDAVRGSSVPTTRTLVLAGMGCDPEVARYHARWRAADGDGDAFAPPLDAPGVLGSMPNVVANRLNLQLDVSGPGFSVSAEEGSGPVALGLAARALRTGEVDAAVVGAVDLSHEPVHQTAVAELGLDRASGDAAVALVLKRRTDAHRDGDTVLARLDEVDDRPADMIIGRHDGSLRPAFDPEALFGVAHAATGLVAVAAAAVALHHRAVPDDSGGPAARGFGVRTAEIIVAVLEAPSVRIRLRAEDDPPVPLDAADSRTGVVLTVPAHPPAVSTRAAAGADSERPDPDAEVMVPAPWLPPLPAPTPEPEPESATHRAREQPPESTPMVGGASTAADVRMTLLDEATAEHQRGLTAALQEFLTQQATVHHEFLAMRQRAHRALPVEEERIARVGPPFDRAQLEQLAGGRVSELFGPAFAAQDARDRQTRMPQPPMLLTDRVTGIDAVPASMGTGTIWTETDVRPDRWYLDPAGRMPAGITVESGQADLLLISWLGADLLDSTVDRVYRLLGCELTFHGGLPRPGETLRFEIGIDGHGEHDGTRLFFFHSDCYVGDELRLSVRDGQAGFFSDAELTNTSGVRWEPAADPPDVAVPLALPEPQAYVARRTFDADQVRAFAEGRPAACFGPEWYATRAHVRTPRISAGQLLLLGEVPDLDPTGGPWQRGYLRAETAISADDWFFSGHFKDDPCMPGTLMLEGCLQAMAFYLGALGFTTDRDGWRFEPASDTPHRMLCRGQVTPQNRLLTYEVFVRELTDADGPLIVADVLCTVDGVKAFLASRVSLRLVRDWPLEQWRQLGPPALQETGEPVALASLGGLVGQRDPVSTTYGLPAVLASAWGRPSEAFPEVYGAVEDTRSVPRLPGPPYLFISRIVSVEGSPGEMQDGAAVVAEYDVSARSWFFEQSGDATMPLAVLMEIALQPCGWLASYVGCSLGSTTDLLFRNLDGTASMDGVIGSDTARVRTRAELREISQLGSTIIVAFDVAVAADEVPAFRTSTVFGFFPPGAFADQAGLPVTEADRARLTESCDRTLPLPTDQVGPMLLMLDRISGYWPDGGAAGLGRLRGEKDVDAGEWFFKAHFYQDPVQPGSLGIEAMYQLLRAYLNETGAADGLRHPRFEPVSATGPVAWRYRGQVVPSNARVTIELEISETGTDEHGRFAIAEAWLWVDGTRIYHVSGLGTRVVESAGADTGAAGAEIVLRATTDTWLRDHRPTWTIPTLPAMSALDLLARAGAAHAGRPVIALRDLRLHRWIQVADVAHLRTEVGTADAAGGDEFAVTLLMWRAARTGALSRYEPVVTGVVVVGETASNPPAPFPPLRDAVPADDPYDAGALFHGPAFQYLVSVREGTGGASGVLHAGRGTVPRGLVHPGLLDASLHVIPHDRLCRWSVEIDNDRIAFPHRIAAFDSYAPLPDTGEVHVEARFAGFDADDRRLPVFDVQLSAGGQLLAAFRLVEILVPDGRIASADPLLRRMFLRDRRYADGIGLSVTLGTATRLSAEEVDRSDWLVGTVAEVYGLPTGTRGRDHLAEIAVRDHIARIARVHPADVVVTDDLRRAWPVDRPTEIHQLDIAQQDEHVTVRSASDGPRMIN